MFMSIWFKKRKNIIHYVNKNHFKTDVTESNNLDLSESDVDSETALTDSMSSDSEQFFRLIQNFSWVILNNSTKGQAHGSFSVKWTILDVLLVLFARTTQGFSPFLYIQSSGMKL